MLSVQNIPAVRGPPHIRVHEQAERVGVVGCERVSPASGGNKHCCDVSHGATVVRAISAADQAHLTGHASLATGTVLTCLPAP
jgi:hypothetical protein